MTFIFPACMECRIPFSLNISWKNIPREKREMKMSQSASEFLSTFQNFSNPKLRCEFSLIGFGLSAFILFLKY